MDELRCPKCGCNDVAERPACGSWGDPGFDCRCRHCGCRFHVKDPAAEAHVIAYAVAFAVQICPHCGSKSTEVTSTRRKQGQSVVRYHRCQSCTKPFKSVEAA